MGFNIFKWQRSVPIITKEQREQALEEWASLNVNVSNLPSYYNNSALFNSKLKMFKSAYISRFIYSKNDKIDTYLLEEVLWFKGQVCVVNNGGMFMVGSFQIEKTDSNNFPKQIKFVPISSVGEKKEKPMKKIYTVGENAIIIKDDRPSLVNNNHIYSPYLIVCQLLKPLLAIQEYKYRNMITSRPIIPVSPLTDLKVVKSLNKAIISKENFLSMGIADNDTLWEKQDPYEFKDRTNEILDNYEHEYNQILDCLGFDSNAFPHKKERQITDEIKSNNTVSQAVLESKIYMRKKGLEDLKKVLGIEITLTVEKESENNAENTSNDNSDN